MINIDGDPNKLGVCVFDILNVNEWLSLEYKTQKCIEIVKENIMKTCDWLRYWLIVVSCFSFIGLHSVSVTGEVHFKLGKKLPVGAQYEQSKNAALEQLKNNAIMNNLWLTKTVVEHNTNISDIETDKSYSSLYEANTSIRNLVTGEITKIYSLTTEKIKGVYYLNCSAEVSIQDIIEASDNMIYSFGTKIKLRVIPRFRSKNYALSIYNNSHSPYDYEQRHISDRGGRQGVGKELDSSGIVEIELGDEFLIQDNFETDVPERYIKYYYLFGEGVDKSGYRSRIIVKDGYAFTQTLDPNKKVLGETKIPQQYIVE